MSDSYYQPPESGQGTYQAPACKGYIANAKVSPLDIGLQLMQAQNLINQGDLPRASFILGGIFADVMQMPVIDEVACNWEGGSVDAEFEGGKDYTVFWTCPRCGSAQEQEREYGDDHPDL